MERQPPALIAAPASGVPDGRITIERSVQAFIAEFQAHAAVNTQKKYRLLLAKLKAFSDSRAYVFIDQWAPIDVREMRAAWSVSPQTAAKLAKSSQPRHLRWKRAKHASVLAALCCQGDLSEQQDTRAMESAPEIPGTRERHT
jgi:hypothetical protein